MSRWKKISIIIIFILLVIFIFPILPMLLPEKVYCHNDYICIESGKAKSELIIMYLTLRSEEKETIISKILKINTESSDWRPVNTFAFGSSVSPHYNFHSALHQVKQVSQSFEWAPFSEESKRFIVKELLKVWKKDNDYHGGENLVNAVSSLAFKEFQREGKIEMAEVKGAYLEMIHSRLQ